MNFFVEIRSLSIALRLLFYTESRHEARNLSERETTVEINRNFCCYFAFDIQGSLKF